MRHTVRVGDPTRLSELVEHLAGLGCSVTVVEGDTAEVELPDVSRADAAELELDLYLRVWEARVGVAASRVER